MFYYVFATTVARGRPRRASTELCLRRTRQEDLCHRRPGQGIQRGRGVRAEADSRNIAKHNKA